MKILLVTKCGCMRVVESKAIVVHEIHFPDGSWRVFIADGGMDDGKRIFTETANFRTSRKGKRKAWERQ